MRQARLMPDDKPIGHSAFRQAQRVRAVDSITTYN